VDPSQERSVAIPVAYNNKDGGVSTWFSKEVINKWVGRENVKKVGIPTVLFTQMKLMHDNI
jgi:hypothetical protein